MPRAPSASPSSEFDTTETQQVEYVRDLRDFAHRNRYLFVIWFVPIDYDRLYERWQHLPDVEVHLIWRNAGFFDKNLRAKPGWSQWQALVRGTNDQSAAVLQSIENLLLDK